MKVGELVKRLGVPYRDVRYVLEQGILPQGVEENPGRGEHRDLSHDQAFYLALILCLKRAGIRTPEAGKISDHTREALRGVRLFQRIASDQLFDPFEGGFESSDRWFVNIGDMQWVKLTMEVSGEATASPLDLPWRDLETRKPVKSCQPLVTVRVDLTGLGRCLATETS